MAAWENQTHVMLPQTHDAPSSRFWFMCSLLQVWNCFACVRMLDPQGTKGAFL